MFAAYALELAEPPGLLDYALQGPPPNPDNNKPWRGLVESRGSGTFWTYMVISEVSGKWEEAYGTVTEGTPLDALTRTARRAWNGTALVTNTKVNWQPSDGPLRVFATPIADVYDGLINHHRGPTPPPWARPGTTWDDDSGAPASVVFKKMAADGTWRVIGVMNETTGVFTPAGGPFLPLTGGALTGDLTINKANPAIAVNTAASGQVAVFDMKTAGALRWRFVKNTAAESGGNAGSDFGLQRFDDAGNVLGTPVLITRSSGNVTLANTLTVTGAATVSGGFNSAGISNLQGSYTAVYGNLTVGANAGGFAPLINGAHVRGSGETTLMVETLTNAQARVRIKNSVRDWLWYADGDGGLKAFDLTAGAERMRMQADGNVVASQGFFAGGIIQAGGEVRAYADASFRMFDGGGGSRYFQARADDWLEFRDSDSTARIVTAGAERLAVTTSTLVWSPAGHTFLIDGIFHFRTFPTAGLPSAAVYSPTWVARTSGPGDWAATNDGATWQLMHFS